MTLIGYWPLNEESGDTAYDHSGKENHGTINDSGDSTVPGANGIIGQNAYSFDGSNDYVDGIGAIRSYFDSGPVAVSIWAYKPSSDRSDQVIFDVDVSRWNINYNKYVNNAWSFDFYDGTEHVIEGPNIEDEWVHFVAQQLSSGDMEFYVNGDLVGTESAADINPNSPSGPVIGSRTQNDDLFSGRLSEVRIYDRPLTKSEVQYLYSVGKRGRHVTSKKSS